MEMKDFRGTQEKILELSVESALQQWAKLHPFALTEEDTLSRKQATSEELKATLLLELSSKSCWKNSGEQRLQGTLRAGQAHSEGQGSP